MCVCVCVCVGVCVWVCVCVCVCVCVFEVADWLNNLFKFALDEPTKVWKCMLFRMHPLCPQIYTELAVSVIGLCLMHRGTKI